MPQIINNPCVLYSKLVNDTHKNIFSNIHDGLIHLKCTSLNKYDYNEFNGSTEDQYCSLCLNDIFPFNTIDDNLEFKNCIF